MMATDLTADRDAITAKMHLLRRALADRDHLAGDILAEDRLERIGAVEGAIDGLVRDLRNHLELVDILRTTATYNFDLTVDDTKESR